MIIIQIVIITLIFLVNLFSLITNNFSYLPITSLLLVLLLGIMAIDEFKCKGNTTLGMLYLLASLLILVMALFRFI